MKFGEILFFEVGGSAIIEFLVPADQSQLLVSPDTTPASVPAGRKVGRFGDGIF